MGRLATVAGLFWASKRASSKASTCSRRILDTSVAIPMRPRKRNELKRGLLVGLQRSGRLLLDPQVPFPERKQRREVA